MGDRQRGEHKRFAAMPRDQLRLSLGLTEPPEELWDWRSPPCDCRPTPELLHRPAGGAWSSLASRIRFEVANVDPHATATRSWFRELVSRSFGGSSVLRSRLMVSHPN